MAEEVIIKSKESFYRGKPLTELKALEVREFAKYLKSRPRRSVLRNFQNVEKFIKRCERKLANGKRIKTNLRDMVITPKLVGMKIAIHNGKAFNDVLIVPEMLGHRLGEFSMTRGRVVHGAAGIGATKSSRAEQK
jgi:small subunit ribosomal protein S19